VETIQEGPGAGLADVDRAIPEVQVLRKGHFVTEAAGDLHRTVDAVLGKEKETNENENPDENRGDHVSLLLVEKKPNLGLEEARVATLDEGSRLLNLQPKELNESLRAAELDRARNLLLPCDLDVVLVNFSLFHQSDDLSHCYLLDQKGERTDVQSVSKG